MIRRPPRSTRTAHSFPTRRSSDLADGGKAGDHHLTDLQSVRLADHTGHRRTNDCAAEIQCCFVPLRLGRGDGRIFARHCRTCSKRRARLCGFRLCCPQFFACLLKSMFRILKPCPGGKTPCHQRSEEHTSELQSLMRISYAVFCLKKKKNTTLIH